MSCPVVPEERPFIPGDRVVFRGRFENDFEAPPTGSVGTIVDSRFDTEHGTHYRIAWDSLPDRHETRWFGYCLGRLDP